MLGPACRAGHGREVLATLVPGPFVDARVLPLFRGVRHADRAAQRDRRKLFDALAISSRGSGELLRRRRDDLPRGSLCGGGGSCFGGAARRGGGAFPGGGLSCCKPPVRRAEGAALAQAAEQSRPGHEGHGSVVQHLMRRGRGLCGRAIGNLHIQRWSCYRTRRLRLRLRQR